MLRRGQRTFQPFCTKADILIIVMRPIDRRAFGALPLPLYKILDTPRLPGRVCRGVPRRQRVHNGSSSQHDGRGGVARSSGVSGGRVPGQRVGALVVRRAGGRRGRAPAAADAPGPRARRRRPGHRRRDAARYRLVPVSPDQPARRGARGRRLPQRHM